MAADQAENPLAMLIVKRAESTALISKAGDFMWFQIYIDQLIRMEHDKDAFKELISLCKAIYQENEVQLHILEEFECTYQASDAVHWYTKATFLYHLLNKALRVQSFPTILPFRTFIRDISKQLESEHKQQKALRENTEEHIIVAYRGQAMSMQEFNEFKNSSDDYFTINSFLSATLNRHLAEMYVVSAPQSDTLISVLMEIEGDFHRDTKAFASIAHLSHFPTELEILFTIGSTFRIRRVQQNIGENYYTLNLVLCSEDDIELKETFKCFKSEYGSCASMASLANVMYRLGELHGARDYYVRAIENTLLTTTNESLLSLSTHERIRSVAGLGFVADQRGDFKRALKCHEYVLALKMQLFPRIHYVIGVSYVNIGNVYYNLEEFDRALSYYNDALEIFTQSCALNDRSRAKSINNIGIVHAAKHSFEQSKGYLQQGFNLLRENYPEIHPDIATSLSNLGLVFRSLQEYDVAEDFQLKALDIRIKTLPCYNIELAQSYHNLGILYETLNDPQLALYYYQEAVDLKTLSLPPSSPEYQQTFQCLVALRREIQNSNTIGIVIAGMPKSGKSSFANLLLGARYFRSYYVPTMGTTECKKSECDFNQRRLIIVDTPSTFITTHISADDRRFQLGQCNSLIESYLKSIIIVISCLCEPSENLIDHIFTPLHDMFGEEFVRKKSVLILTHFDKVIKNEPEKPFDEFLNDKPHLVELIARCNQRYINGSDLLHGATTTEAEHRENILKRLIDIIINL